MTYSRTIGKALDKFHIDASHWPELAADRAAWRATLRDGIARPSFRLRASSPPPPSPEPLARTKPMRAAAAQTNARILYRCVRGCAVRTPHRCLRAETLAFV